MYITIIWFVTWIDAYHIPVSSTNSHHVHLRVFFPSYSYIYWHMYCVNTTLAEHAYYTVLCSTITTLGYHHTSSTSTSTAISSAKSSAFPFHCFTSLSSGPLTTFQMAFHGFHGKDQSNKKRDLLPLFTLHDFMFSEKKMKTLMKSIKDSFE